MPRIDERERAEATYRGRTHAVGALAFDGTCPLASLSELFSTFVHAFCPRDGLRIRVSRGARSEVLPNRFSVTSTISERQLARGGSVELTRGDFDRPGRDPLFWITSRAAAADGEEVSPDDELARVVIGLSLGRPGGEEADAAVTEALTVMTESAGDLDGCLAAVLTAQGAPLTKSGAVLPYEVIAGTARFAERARFLRENVRSPGWQVLVPAVRIRDLPQPLPERVLVQRVESGLLVRDAGETPFTMELEELARWLGPVLGGGGAR